jgi:hypothetical protein
MWLPIKHVRKERLTHVLYDYFNFSSNTKYTFLVEYKDKNKINGPSVGRTKLQEKARWKEGMVVVT